MADKSLIQRPKGVKIKRSKMMVNIDIIDLLIGDWWSNPGWLAWELQMAGGKDVHFKLHCDGGDFLASIGMKSLLDGYKGKVTIEGLGFVASAATMFMAGGEAGMRDGSFMMIHEPYTERGGTSTEMRKNADLLDTMMEEAADIYIGMIERNGKTIKKKEVIKWMKEEKWFTAKEALKVGLISKIYKGKVYEVKDDDKDRLEEYVGNFENVPGAVLNLFNKNNVKMKKVKSKKKKKVVVAKKEVSRLGKVLNFIKSLVSEEDVIDEVAVSKEDKKLIESLKAKGLSDAKIKEIMAGGESDGGDAELNKEEVEELKNLLSGDVVDDEAIEAEKLEVAEMKKKLKLKMKKMEKRERKNKLIQAGDAGGDKKPKGSKVLNKALNNRKRVKSFDKLAEALMSSMKN